jgi:hypothetical protein
VANYLIHQVLEWFSGWWKAINVNQERRPDWTMLNKNRVCATGAHNDKRLTSDLGMVEIGRNVEYRSSLDLRTPPAVWPNWFFSPSQRGLTSYASLWNWCSGSGKRRLIPPLPGARRARMKFPESEVRAVLSDSETN